MTAKRCSSASSLPPDVADKDADVDENPLTVDTMVASLDFLTHNDTGCLVYAMSNLSSRQLTSIEVMGKYKHLQRVSLNDNKLTSLKPLQELYCLVYLSAENNQLTNEVFNDLAPSGVTLERLNLNKNKLTSLRGLHQLPYLVDFHAAENQVTELVNEDFASLHSLTRLNLMSNKIQRVQLNTFATCRTVRRLNLSHNELQRVQFVIYLAHNLETLNLQCNKIKRLDGFDVLRQLVDLQLANNDIDSWVELETLSGLVNLRHLAIAGNPILQEIKKDCVSKPLPEYAESKVATDVDFSTCKFTGNFGSITGADVSNSLLSSMVTPCARTLVKEAVLVSRKLEEWDGDELRELSQLSVPEQHRFRVISILQQLTTIDSVPVAPNEIPRALRLFKNKDGKRCPVGGNLFPVGSAAKAVESQRAKNGAGTQ